jgi:hypothetical protein
MRTLTLLVAVLVLLSCDVPLPRPAAVELAGPIDGAVLTYSEVEFSWWSDGYSAWEFQVAEDRDFDRVVRTDTIEADDQDQALRTVDLRKDDTYWWRVRARSEEQVWGDWSETRSLSIERFKVVAQLATQGYAQDIWVDGDRAYIADGQAGLAVFDVGSPESPELLGYVSDGRNIAYGVTALGDYAYVAYGYKELLVANVADPDSMFIAGELEYVQPGNGFDIALSGDSLAFVAADAQFIYIDVTDPFNPGLKEQFNYPRGCRGIDIEGNRCYLALEQVGVAIWDIGSAPIKTLGEFDTPSNARSVAADGGMLYVADGNGGLLVADVSVPESAEVEAVLDLPDYAERVTVSDTLVYVGCRNDGVVVVNVSDPAEPFIVAAVKTDYARCAMENDGYVYACDRDLGLVVVRIKE